MQMPVQDVSKKILSKQIDKQDAMRLFQSLDREAQSQVLAILRRADGIAQTHDGATRALKALDPRELTGEHHAWIAALVERYDRFVPKSRAHALEHRTHAVDGRRASRPIDALKSLDFPIAFTRAEGAYVHDADGNRYIDMSADMGANLFGHRAPFLIDAVKDALDRGTPLTGDCDMRFRACASFCAITGHERALFTPSAGEALTLALRIARASTGRRKIVLFGDGHRDVSDAEAVIGDFGDQIIALNDGDMASLDAIERRAGEIAAVLVDPARSRHAPGRSAEFLKALRQLTVEKNIALILDEAISGFRVCPHDAQRRFGIQADMAVYGDIVGGGLPTGVIAGTSKYMDTIDGGAGPSAGDDKPDARRAPIAAPFVQNALTTAAAVAFLEEIGTRCGDGAQSCGGSTCFQRVLGEKTARLADALHAFFDEERLAVAVETFGSSFRFRFVDGERGLTEALFSILLRMEGLRTDDRGDCFLSTAHTDEDIEAVIAGVKTSLSNLKRSGFFRERDERPTPEAAAPPATAASASPQSEDASPLDASPRKEMERLRALLAADLALAEESGNY